MTGTEAAPDDEFAAVLRPVRAGSGFEEALERILQVLRLGLVPYGERLPSERELADRLRISRVTLREVLKVLQDQGLVESRRGRYGGTFVLYTAGGLSPEGRSAPVAGGTAAPAGAELEDLLRFREVLETGAAELCAGRVLDAGQRALLRDCLTATVDAPLGDYRRLDTRLHLTLAELSGSPSLAAAYTGVRASVNDALDRIPLLVRNLAHSQAQHTALVDAVVEGDVEGAREVMREHCAGTASLLRGFLL
ncbi:FadR/GntR family transcriptional regulator [Streptantibioticus silvisoli]|uniref:FCD domain-containing protein n=1 Tax=Streptantibioticus silvisoli TaxID=2705255 RepID=A0ABT6W5N4_9ACTN|nr:FCD domain-containing protein [Streptantibioticus silvisoli]MDI5966060.1 FCD domain-containing protein [Streptantibioticus silvisoli]